VPVGTRLQGALRNVLDSRRNFKPLPTDRKLRDKQDVVHALIRLSVTGQVEEMGGKYTLVAKP